MTIKDVKIRKNGRDWDVVLPGGYLAGQACRVGSSSWRAVSYDTGSENTARSRAAAVHEIVWQASTCHKAAQQIVENMLGAAGL